MEELSSINLSIIERLQAKNRETHVSGPAFPGTVRPGPVRVLQWVWGLGVRGSKNRYKPAAPSSTGFSVSAL